MAKKKYSKTQYRLVGPAVGTTLINLLRIDFDHFLHWIPFVYWLKRPINYLVCLIYAPFNLFEVIKYGKRIRETQLNGDPVFIVGHWRSGTTHLHNLLVQDPKLGFTTQMQCLFPNSFLTNPLVKFFIKNFQPSTRPMDNMAIDLETPQEEEIATANTMLYSFYNAWAYPKSLMRDYKRYVLFEGLSERQKRKWQKGYMRVCKKATIYHQGRRLVLKNPANTSRIPALLELFPNAKFIHIYRHPVNVFYSTRKLYATAMPNMAHQDLSQEESDAAIMEIYDDMMHRFFEDRHLIPKENLFEVRYEDFEHDRMGILASMYNQFNLPGWEDASGKIQQYLDDLGTYQKNKFPFTYEECQLVRDKWGFAFDELQYGPQP